MIVLFTPLQYVIRDLSQHTRTAKIYLLIFFYKWYAVCIIINLSCIAAIGQLGGRERDIDELSNDAMVSY